MNKSTSREPAKQEEELPKEQLNVRIPEELWRRVNAVAGASGKSQAEFVTDVLDERTKDHKADVERIWKREKDRKSQ